MSLRLVIKKTVGGAPFSVNVEPDITISDLKAEVSTQAAIPAEEQRLIYKGQILKDDKTVKDYGIEADHVLHLVRGRPAGSTSSPAASAPAQGSAQPAASGAAMGASMGAPGGGMPGMMGMDPQQMQQMMGSPIVQNLLDNPEFLRSMMQSNPALRQMMEANPEMAHMMNDPEMMRQAMRMATNPGLMQEQMRNADRAMTNIESHPEGFNALRRVYETIQEPMQQAAGSGADATRDAAANPFLSLFQPSGGASTGAPAEPATSGAPNVAPLPNPWAPPASGAPAASAPAAGGMPDFSHMMGAMGGAGGLGSAGAADAGGQQGMLQMLENPQMQEQMAQMLAMPGFMDSMVQANPQLRAAVEANPGLRQMMSNPEFVRQMLNPGTMRQMMQMQQMMGGMGAGGMGAGGLPGAAGGQPGAQPAGMPDFASMMGMMGGMQGMGALGGGGVPPIADPETAYATQIQQLVDMGFFDREANIRALQQTGGNVNAAVERLLSS